MHGAADSCPPDVEDPHLYKCIKGHISLHVKSHLSIYYIYIHIIEGSLEVKLPTIWTDEKQSREEAERRERLEERRVKEKE